MKVTVVLWIPNPFLLQVTKKNQTFSKWHCKTSEIWPKISIKENFCKRTVRRKAVLLWEISCQAVFVCESCYGSTKSTKYRRFDGANYSTRLHFSVNSNVVPKLFTYSQNYERRRAGKRSFFLSIYDDSYLGEFVHVMK